MASIPYIEECSDEINRNDGLVVIAKGLGLQQIVAKTLEKFISQLFGQENESNSVIFMLHCENMTNYLQKTMKDCAMENKWFPQEITAEQSAAERCELYLQGGCFCITSRILVVDLLNKVRGCRIHKRENNLQKTYVLPDFPRASHFFLLLLLFYREFLRKMPKDCLLMKHIGTFLMRGK